jgi:2-isopropylmalate synthase
VAIALALHGEEMALMSTIDNAKLWPLCRLVSELTGIPLAPNKPVGGDNIFATEAGIHQDGLLKDPDTYLPYRPEKIGGPGIRLVLGKHSGRAAISARLRSLDLDVDESDLDRVIEIAKSAPKEAWNNDRELLGASVALVRAGSGC